MRVGIVVLCRYSSSRLPGKILKKINGISLLEMIIARLKQSKNNIPIVIATSSDSSDDAIVHFCDHIAIPVFRGSLDNVSQRFRECAKHFDFEYAIRINGDNLFTDCRIIDEMIEIVQQNNYDFVSNVEGRTFPFGMSVEIMKMSFYDSIIDCFNHFHQEHVTSYLYENKSIGQRYNYTNKTCKGKGINLAIDTSEDFQKAEKIIFLSQKNFVDLSFQDVIFMHEKISSPWSGKFGPLLIAEIGGNHEGNFEYAIELTKLAIDSGADYIKYQIYTGDTLVNPLESKDRNEHFKKFTFSKEQHIQIAELCQSNNVGYMASVWDTEYLEWIDPFMKIYKIGSGDLTAYPMIEKIVNKQKPIILSTGLSYESEVVETINYIRGLDSFYESADNLSILQCTSMYPIPDSEANLNVMEKLRKTLNLTVGYSDHTEGKHALEIAYAMGAQILEFHFTDSREGKSFRDHKVSLTNPEVKELIASIVKINELKGSAEKKPLEIEGDHVITFRRALYPIVDIPENTIITKSHLTSLRPNHGIDARDFNKILGMKTNKKLQKYERLDWTFFDEPAND